jgi:hypothetical protein
LNERQRTYLREAFKLDQEIEAAVKERRARGWFDEPPASVWRWLRYGYVSGVDDPSGLALRLGRHEATDEGTGSTWQALARRGLIKTRYVAHPILKREQLMEVQLTTLGRRVMRAVEPTEAKPRQPAGMLTEWQWRALARIAAAMPDGIAEVMGGYEGIGDATLRRLEEGRDGRLVAEVDPETGEDPGLWWGSAMRHGTRRALRLTERGRDYYRQHHARHRELYPDVDAPVPPSGELTTIGPP